MVLSVKKGDPAAVHLTPIDFASAGIKEVTDLKKWILSSPKVLGEDLFVIGDEFHSFDNSRDRVDILCIDKSGHPVVVELKRTRHADFAELQAVRYAAELRSLRLAAASVALADSEEGKAQGLSLEAAQQKIRDFLSDSDIEELENEPRILLVSPGFSPQLLTTVHFLREHQIDISCIAIRAYRIEEGHFVIVPDVVLPLRELEDFLVQVRKKEASQREAERKRLPRSFPLLVERGLLKQGTVLYLKHNLPLYIREKFKEGDPQFEAEVMVPEGGPPKLKWKGDGQQYSPTDLTRIIFNRFKPDAATNPVETVGGPYYWGTKEKSLNDWATEVFGNA